MRTIIAAMMLMMTSAALADLPPPPPAAQGATALDPEKVAIAKQIRAKVLPPGAMQMVMHGIFDQIPEIVNKQIITMPMARLLIAAGVSAETANKVSSENAKQAEAILDPTYEQKVQVALKVMIDGEVDTLNRVMPIMDDAMVSAYARHFDKRQLSDILAFFNTPSGTAYAARALTLTSDPDIRAAITKMMPLLMNSTPNNLRTVKAALETLPKARDPATLSDVEWTKVGQLLGCDPVQLKKAAVAVRAWHVRFSAAHRSA